MLNFVDTSLFLQMFWCLAQLLKVFVYINGKFEIKFSYYNLQEFWKHVIITPVHMLSAKYYFNLLFYEVIFK